MREYLKFSLIALVLFGVILGLREAWYWLGRGVDHLWAKIKTGSWRIL